MPESTGQFRIHFSDTKEVRSFNKERILLGRLETCDVVLDDPTVSRVHAGITFSEERYVLANLSRFRGNDLSTAHPEFNFPGLKPGDRWCLCAARWLEAHEHGMAPRVVLKGTHSRAVEIVPLALLKKFAIDLN